MKNMIIGLILGAVAISTLTPTTAKAAQATFTEYTETDADFAEENFTEANRLGDTDFYGFVRSDGVTVILEEDMKWTLQDADLDEITKRLEAFDHELEQCKTNYTYHNWLIWATEAIEGR